MSVEKLLDQIKSLPRAPGVYLFYDKHGALMYVGKATSLRARVESYFSARARGAERAIEQVIAKVDRIKHIETPTVWEAVLKEAELIRRQQPPYNVLLKDDKSFVWICFMADEYPRVVMVRGKELVELGARGDKIYPQRWGPFTSTKLVRLGLGLLRKIFPWSDCLPNKTRPCFNAQIGLCPGVCTRALTPREYKIKLKRLADFLSGRRRQVERSLQVAMHAAARAREFEQAAELRNQLFALQHIADLALIGEVAKNDAANAAALLPKNKNNSALPARIEGYDISHLAGKDAVASMVVFEAGEPNKNLYRRFALRTAPAGDDLAALTEVLSRRLAHKEWPQPEIIFVDGGEPQVNQARRVLQKLKIKIPVLGIAKGPTRKQVRFVFDRADVFLARLVRLYPHVFVRVRDEAHRFAISYQRSKRKLKNS